ncbi:hypothetical protein FBEOM_6118 [Fusarium beomiforme]|uniref:Uncharacterized protein n=1 Tax=Fusarium beomiforme TaxID=44412 RepID=A0A9P5DWM6_9HYPO|nr:hypothetical protein FBEOM_6118 [Fusarium beomiforme]
MEFTPSIIRLALRNSEPHVKAETQTEWETHQDGQTTQVKSSALEESRTTVSVCGFTILSGALLIPGSALGDAGLGSCPSFSKGTKYRRLGLLSCPLGWFMATRGGFFAFEIGVGEWQKDVFQEAG